MDRQTDKYKPRLENYINNYNNNGEKFHRKPTQNPYIKASKSVGLELQAIWQDSDTQVIRPNGLQCGRLGFYQCKLSTTANQIVGPSLLRRLTNAITIEGCALRFAVC